MQDAGAACGQQNVPSVAVNDGDCGGNRPTAIMLDPNAVESDILVRNGVSPQNDHSPEFEMPSAVRKEGNEIIPSEELMPDATTAAVEPKMKSAETTSDAKDTTKVKEIVDPWKRQTPIKNRLRPRKETKVYGQQGIRANRVLNFTPGEPDGCPISQRTATRGRKGKRAKPDPDPAESESQLLHCNGEVPATNSREDSQPNETCSQAHCWGHVDITNCGDLLPVAGKISSNVSGNAMCLSNTLQPDQRNSPKRVSNKRKSRVRRSRQSIVPEAPKTGIPNENPGPDVGVSLVSASTGIHQPATHPQPEPVLPANHIPIGMKCINEFVCPMCDRHMHNTVPSYVIIRFPTCGRCCCRIDVTEAANEKL